MLNRVTIAVLILLNGMNAGSQSRYRFRTLDIGQGLTSDFVWSVCQDKYNYIWIGTQNGLNRYDGHNIRQYFNDPKDSFSIPGNSIYWIYKDANEDLWFSLGYKGVARYNYSKDRFERFPLFDSINRKNNHPVWRMGNDGRGRIYFACGSACFRYTKETNVMEDITPLFNGAIEGYGVGMFIPKGKNDLWILTGNGLFHYSLDKNLITHIPFDKEKMGFGGSEMHDGEFINDHELLLSVVRTGFVLFDTRTGKFRLPPAPFDPTHSGKFSETGGVLKDSKGRIWLANSRYGLLEYFPQKNSSYSLKNEPSYPYPYAEQEGNGMNVYEDNDGNIWYCSSSKGVIWFRPETDFIQLFQRNFAAPNSLPDNLINYFLPVKKNKILVGTNKGVTLFDTESNMFQNYPVAFNDKDIFPHPYVRAMIKSGDTVFITTYKGLSALNTRTGKFRRFVDSGAAIETDFPYGQWLIHKVSSNELIITGNKAARFYIDSNKYVRGDALNADPVYTLADINATYFDEKKSTLWLEAGYGKLFAYNTTEKKLEEHSYTSDSIAMIDAIVADESGNLWLGTTGGLYNYDPRTRKGHKVALNTIERSVFNIWIQDNEHIWLATPREIVRYNQRIKKADILNINTFLPNSYITRRAFMLDTAGWLWTGTNKGFFKIEVGRFASAGISREPSLVSFSVLNQPKFNSHVQQPDRIRLNHNENFFSFAISSFDYQSESSIQYAYMLEGFDKDWQSANENSGSYTNVPPGRYKLHLRSNNGIGGWVSKKDPVMIIVGAPFWQTWWFMFIVLLAAMLVIASVYRLMRKRKQKRQMTDAIEYFANSHYGENSLSEICWDIARNCMSQLKLKDCVVYLLDENRNILVQRAAFGPKNLKDQEIINPIEIEVGKGIVGTAAESARPVMVTDTSRDNRYIVDDVRRFSELAVPIIHEGRAIGVIDSEHPKKNFFNEDHVKVLSTIAAISANKIAETKAEETARETELKLLEIKKLLAESQLMALRAQMNPHFVFNCLNSIQECIVTQKYGEASLYLNKFSKLFRSVLNNSGSVMISLAEEIEVLELYLSLEHMRFDKSFNYSIHVEEDVETDEIMIPSMLLQPYVENALWHGLMHKDDDRELDIRFRKLNDEIFQCVVEDNGIGRKKALELKALQNKTKRHQSKGMSIARDRIDLLQKQGQHASLNIIDKSDERGFATGTKVVIELSTYLKA